MKQVKMNEIKQKSIASKIVSLFWEPSLTFNALKVKVNWMDLAIPMLIIIVASLISSSYIIPIAMNDTRARIENSERFPDAQKEAALERIEKRAESPVQYVTTIVAIGVKWLVIAGMMLFIGNFLLGGELTFVTMLGVSAYIGLIDVVNTGIKTPLIVSQQSTKVYSSLALLMEESSTFLYRFLSNIDIFAIWKIVLFSIALGILLNTKTSKTFWVILIVWLLYAIAAAMLAGLVKF